MKVEQFFSKVKADVEAKLWEIISEQTAYEKLKYALSGGKRLRPCLAMLVFDVCGGRNRARALEAATAIELMHSASLVHDDILDRDLQRRGKPAAYLKYGVEDAILLGHKMVSLGFKIIVNHGLEVIKTFVETWDLALEGEMMDMELSKREIEDLITNGKKLYFDVISKKTASLFAGSCKIGAQEAEVGNELQNLFWKYGNLVGIAHQLADDYVEMKRGKLETLPLTLLVGTTRFRDKVKEKLKQLAKEGILKKSNVDIEHIFKSEIEKVILEAESLAKDERIPNSPYKKFLVEVPKYIVKRMLAEAGVRNFKV